MKLYRRQQANILFLGGQDDFLRVASLDARALERMRIQIVVQDQEARNCLSVWYQVSPPEQSRHAAQDVVELFDLGVLFLVAVTSTIARKSPPSAQ